MDHPHSEGMLVVIMAGGDEIMIKQCFIYSTKMYKADGSDMKPDYWESVAWPRLGMHGQLSVQVTLW